MVGGGLVWLRNGWVRGPETGLAGRRPRSQTTEQADTVGIRGVGGGGRGRSRGRGGDWSGW